MARLVTLSEDRPRLQFGSARQAGSAQGLLLYMAEDFDAPLGESRAYPRVLDDDSMLRVQPTTER